MGDKPVMTTELHRSTEISELGWRAPSRIGFAAPAGKRAHKTWKRRKASGRK